MDVFDEGLGDDILPEDWAKVERARRTNGYKEGLAAGQDSCLQQGFNTGFSKGTSARFSFGFIKGIINALITSLHPRNKDVEDVVTMEAIKDLEDIMSDVESLLLEMRATKKRCSSSGERSGLSKDSQTKKCEGNNNGKPTCCLDSESSLNNPSSSKSGCVCNHSRDNVTGRESTALGHTEEEFYSQHPELQKIVDRLKPHLAQNHCQDILHVSHQFLVSE